MDLATQGVLVALVDLATQEALVALVDLATQEALAMQEALVALGVLVPRKLAMLPSVQIAQLRRLELLLPSSQMQDLGLVHLVHLGRVQPNLELPHSLADSAKAFQHQGHLLHHLDQVK